MTNGFEEWPGDLGRLAAAAELARGGALSSVVRRCALCGEIEGEEEPGAMNFEMRRRELESLDGDVSSLLSCQRDDRTAMSVLGVASQHFSPCRVHKSPDRNAALA